MLCAPGPWRALGRSIAPDASRPRERVRRERVAVSPRALRSGRKAEIRRTPRNGGIRAPWYRAGFPARHPERRARGAAAQQRSTHAAAPGAERAGDAGASDVRAAKAAQRGCVTPRRPPPNKGITQQIPDDPPFLLAEMPLTGVSSTQVSLVLSLTQRENASPSSSPLPPFSRLPSTPAACPPRYHEKARRRGAWFYRERRISPPTCWQTWRA